MATSRIEIHATPDFSPSSSAPFASAQPHRLAVLLKLRDQCITMLHHIRILLVLVIRPVRLDNPIHAVNRASNAVAGDELGQVTVIDRQLPLFIWIPACNSP